MSGGILEDKPGGMMLMENEFDASCLLQ